MPSTDPHEVASLLFAAAEATRVRFDELCTRYDLTAVQARVMLALEPDEPMSMGELAALLRCDQSNVTRLIARLWRLDLVLRVEDPADHRVRRLELTRRGHAVRRKLEEGLHETSPFLSNLTEREVRTLRNLLRKAVTDRAVGSTGRSTGPWRP